MDDKTKQKLLRARQLLKDNAPDTYKRFVSLKMSKGEKHEDNKAVQSGTQDNQVSLVGTDAKEVMPATRL